MGSKTVAILGGGPAGLTAAYQILKTSPDTKVIVFESANILGGISATVSFNGNRMDLGGHRFFTKSQEVSDIWFELLNKQSEPAKDGQTPSNYSTIGIPGDPDGDPETSDLVMLERQRVSRIYYKGKFFDYPVKLNARLFAALGLGGTLKVGFGYLATLFKKLPEDSLENFYINRFGRPLYKMFFETYTEKLWGIHPSKLDASWGAQRVKGLSILGVLKEALFKPKVKETTLIDRFLYPKLGPGQLWEVMAEKIVAMGGEIKLATNVVGLTPLKDGGWEVLALSGDDTERVTVDDVFSSAPVRDLVRMLPSVPAEVRHASDSLNYRDMQVCGILLNKLGIVNKKSPDKLIPDCWIYIQDRNVTAGRIQILNNWSPYLVASDDKHWVSLEYFCTAGDDMWRMSDDDFYALVRDDAIKLGMIDSDTQCEFHRVRVSGAYPVYDEAYSHFDIVKQYLNSLDGLYCIGRNGQHRYNNLDHSMLTACEAVRVWSGIGDKEIIWAVNTDSEYHEEKSQE